MATCNPTIDMFQREDGTLNVSEKYLQLMRDSVSEDSLYIRAKDTLVSQFKDLQLDEKEKAAFITEYVSNMSVALSAEAMKTALMWSKEERDSTYTLAKVKADTEVALAQYEKTKSEICLVDKQTYLQCANVTATLSTSYRENGLPSGYDADGCKPTGLVNEGLKYEQTKQVIAATYQTHADAFRKSGVVQVGVDIADEVIKGLSGDEDGYTYQQIQNAERQRIAYEDSKRNHVANSSAVMIGQLLDTESEVDFTSYIDLWKESITYLNTSHSSTSNP